MLSLELLESGFELANALERLGHVVLELEDLAHADEADTLVRELLDPLEELDVAFGVAAAPALGAGGLDQALALVDPKRLRVDARQLGRHRDDVERPLALGSAGRVIRHGHT